MLCIVAVCSSLLLMPNQGVASDTASVNNPDYQINSAQNEAENNNRWFDIWQRSFTDSMDFTVKQLDGLFLDDDARASHKQARAEGRVQLAWEPRTGMLSDTDLRFRIRVQLPALEDRVDLLLSDNEDETQDNTIRAARNTDNNDRDRTTIALRFRPEQDSHYSFRVGAGRRDQLYVKARYRDALALSSQWAMLYDSELYFYSRDRLGAETGVAFQYDVNEKHLFRQNNRFYFRDDTNDWLWRHEVHHLYSVDEHNAIVPHFMVEGLSQPNYRVEEIYAGMRWRNNTLRDWLFFEVEPFVLWLRNEDFRTSYGVALRIEAYYGKDT
ncbi:hypothetical protein LHL20_10850 [Alteromonas sp. McT4-15]|uniref:hypothetical protein n=1 Tax=Alteromonas sp. McT4-15 TaxID=2881256 RepID=UPI001CF84B86|nr:hypothetical protein [Alteromonas sp. McT4-15]MCB4436726.1 hypothetical protein [Alteromonas sp. McT4-15]